MLRPTKADKTPTNQSIDLGEISFLFLKNLLPVNAM